MNPAISFSNFICGRLSAIQAFNDYDGGIRQIVGANSTLGVFVPLPQPYLSTAGCIIDQTMASAFLTIVVLVICDKRNGVPLVAQPVMCMLLVSALAFFYSVNAGAEVNPARDVGPKLMALCVGYGWEVIRLVIYLRI
ncbi:unnamed protein product [Gongylonema pulchrum]|uniref:Aquaporin n=1 Tax=Gongylonema pulchrum TaxID=637853 RepID=A0A183D253_9BILA|nr:unnamed protein product [Gongylonema pulchrum]